MSLLRPLLVLFGCLTLLTGVMYPLLVTGIGKAAFPRQVAGSLVVRGNEIVGSSLIGQSFQEPRYFWGRLSATAPMPYNGAASGGSNLGPTNPLLLEAVKARIDALKAADPTAAARIPVDLVTASASGLDPHITPAAARYQVARVARARGIDAATVAQLVTSYTERSHWLPFEEARVNVLMLNLALDRLR